MKSLFTVGCLPGEFECHSGYGCFDDLSIVCDRIYQCADESDELGCLFGEYMYNNVHVSYAQRSGTYVIKVKITLRTRAWFVCFFVCFLFCFFVICTTTNSYSVDL